MTREEAIFDALITHSDVVLTDSYREVAASISRFCKQIGVAPRKAVWRRGDRFDVECDSGVLAQVVRCGFDEPVEVAGYCGKVAVVVSRETYAQKLAPEMPCRQVLEGLAASIEIVE